MSPPNNNSMRLFKPYLNFIFKYCDTTFNKDSNMKVSVNSVSAFGRYNIKEVDMSVGNIIQEIKKF